MKYPQIALSLVLYWVGHVASVVLEWTFDDDDDDDEPAAPPLKQRIAWAIYQWCMCTSARLDKWDAVWKSARRP